MRRLKVDEESSDGIFALRWLARIFAALFLWFAYLQLNPHPHPSYDYQGDEVDCPAAISWLIGGAPYTFYDVEGRPIPDSAQADAKGVCDIDDSDQAHQGVAALVIGGILGVGSLLQSPRNARRRQPAGLEEWDDEEEWDEDDGEDDDEESTRNKS